MSLAFVFYTGGVWAERLRRELLWSHVGLFWLGIACDSWATSIMFAMLRATGEVSSWWHTVTGAAALVLMLVHALWATWTAWRGSAAAKRGFHRYSLAVWAVWLVPYFGGMIAGIARGVSG
jgi:uncharacterized repeat protein (TIGR03987 family)